MGKPCKYSRTDIVEAMQYTGDADIQDLLNFTAPSRFNKNGNTIELQVLGGEILIESGDYLIRMYDADKGSYRWYTANAKWFTANHAILSDEVTSN